MRRTRVRRRLGCEWRSGHSRREPWKDPTVYRLSNVLFLRSICGALSGRSRVGAQDASRRGGRACGGWWERVLTEEPSEHVLRSSQTQTQPE